MAADSSNPELDKWVEGDDAVPEAEEIVETVTEAEPEATEEAEAEADSSTTGDEGTTPAPETADKTLGHVPVPALLDERQKRQQAEQEARELRARLDALEQPAAPDPATDPAGAHQHLTQMLDDRLSQMQVATSRMAVMTVRPDYAEKEAVFMQLAKDNPLLVQEMYASGNPAMFAYDTAVKHEEMQALQDVDAYKAKIRAEVEAEIKAEQAAAGEKRAKAKAAAAVPDLASATAASSKGEVPDDDDLASICLGS